MMRLKEDNEKVDILFMVSCVLALFLSTMVQTVLQIIFPAIEKELGMSSSDVNIIVFLPIAAVFISLIPVAVLADRYGKRKLFLWGIGLMCVSMICSTFAFDFYSLAISRLLTGVAAACLTCTALSLVTDNSPRRILALCLGFCTAGSSLGAMLSPSLGNFINEIIGWRWIFVITLFCLLIAALLMIRSSCTNRPDEGRNMDRVGLMLFTVGAFVFVLGLNNIPLWYGFVFFIVGSVILVLFLVRESRTGQHTFKLDLFRNKMFSVSCIVAVVFYMCTIAITYWSSVYLIAIGDMPMMEISLLMAIAPLLQAVLSPFVAQYGSRFDPHYFPTIGLAIVIIGLVLIMMCPFDRSHLEFIVPALVFSAVGYAFFAVENNKNIMTCVEVEDRNFASSMIGSMTALGRYVAMVLVSCAGFIIASQMHFSASDLHSAFMLVFPTMIALCLLAIFACYRVRGTE